MRTLSVVLLLFFQFHVWANNSYDKTYFEKPIDHTIRLAGTFGELRSNHFHMGIDIKSSKGSSGDAIYAAAEGHISRIKVQPGGYGNVIYIDHPNGYTTVYAHLKQFEEQVAQYVKNQQYQKQLFEVDLYPDPSLFPVKKKEQIGLMGTSGRSYGPHLHFEIRETGSEIPVNPILFGLEPKDNKPPVIASMKFFHLDDKLKQVNKSVYTVLGAGTGKFKLKSDTISVGAWRVGLGIISYDLMDNISNKNGIYGVRLLVDDEEVFKNELEKVSFDETRYINACIDFSFFKKTKSRYFKLFKMPGNHLNTINQSGQDVIKLYKDKPRKIEIITYDAQGNQSSIKYWIKRSSKMKEPKTFQFNYLLPHNEPNIINLKDLKIILPENVLYEDLYLYLKKTNESVTDVKSPVFHIADTHTPLHKYIEIYIDGSQIAEEDRKNVCIVSCDNMLYSTWGGTWEGNYIKTEIKEFGSYCLMQDTKAPTIKVNRFKKELGTSKTISFIIDDNLVIKGKTPELKADAYINGEWVLMNYDKKNKKITHRIDPDLPYGSYEFKLVVTDPAGNQATFADNFQKSRI